MKKPLLMVMLTLLTIVSVAQNNRKRAIEKNPTVNALIDLSHSFSFYADGRFATQYLEGQHSAMCWGNLYDFDFKNTNLLILLSCDDRSPYTKKDIAAIKKYVNDGGGLVILGSENLQSQGEMAKIFGAQFSTPTTNQIVAKRYSTLPIENQGNQATTLKLNNLKNWEVIATDSEHVPVLAFRSYGNGRVLVGSRSLAGSHPNASDSINTTLWKPLLLHIAKGKKIDPYRPYNGRGWSDLGNQETRGELDISYNDYLAPYADAMFKISARSMPVIEARMGVPLSKGMGSKIMLLATDGGGFSSGESIALAVWWGGFPDKDDSMIEFITHESVHSWVLPYPEIWNEPIATYVGNLVMIDMGYKEEGERRIAAQIKRAVGSDPNFNLYDTDGKSNKEGVTNLPKEKVNDLHWGKTYWIWEQMRAKNPNVVADYFKAKRKYATRDVVKDYEHNNTVAVMSIAMGEDMFPWFRSIGFDVKREKADIKF